MKLTKDMSDKIKNNIHATQTQTEQDTFSEYVFQEDIFSKQYAQHNLEQHIWQSAVCLKLLFKLWKRRQKTFAYNKICCHLSLKRSNYYSFGGLVCFDCGRFGRDRAAYK